MARSGYRFRQGERAAGDDHAGHDHGDGPAARPPAAARQAGSGRARHGIDVTVCVHVRHSDKYRAPDGIRAVKYWKSLTMITKILVCYND
jgi:hypothetical protein